MKRWLFLALCLFATLSFFALGEWQVERRTWKLALLAAVDKRVHAPPAVPPGPPRWGSVNAADDAYRHVIVRGQFLVDHDTLVQALTERGPGFWIMSPLKTDQGFIVLINRGFVPAEWHGKTSGTSHGRTSITGLLRLTEPGGSFLQANQPLAGRWHSRDVAAIARARGLNRMAPYFIDADTAPNPGGWPKGGLTVISFPNNHLVYAFTWFALAALSLFGSYQIRVTLTHVRDSQSPFDLIQHCGLKEACDGGGNRSALGLRWRWFAAYRAGEQGRSAGPTAFGFGGDL